ncbi:MAG: hypothetical protein ACFE8N_12515, partial [Promethearchaeota archaeon]
MSKIEAVISCKDNDAIKTVLEAHLIHARHDVSIGAAQLFREAAKDIISSDHVDWFLTDLLALVGMEVEGQEISVGFLYFKNHIPTDTKENLYFAKLGKWLNKTVINELHFGQKGFSVYRKIVRRLRSELIGWITGNFLEPILILVSGKKGVPRIKDIKILMIQDTNITTAHSAYSKITNDSNSFAIWIKPAASIRLYRDGTLFGQIMRLRDAGGWTTRHINRILDIIVEISKYVNLSIDKEVCRKMILEPSISMSEHRKGCTIVIMDQET